MWLTMFLERVSAVYTDFRQMAYASSDDMVDDARITPVLSL